MDQRLSFVTLGVGDLARSIAFYEALGWRRPTTPFEGVAFFAAGGTIVSLYPRAELARDAGVPAEGSGFRGFSLAHNVAAREAVDAVLAQAAAAGGRVTAPAQDAVWGGYHGHFADPDGFLWEIAWNPGMPLGEEGRPRLPD